MNQNVFGFYLRIIKRVVFPTLFFLIVVSEGGFLPEAMAETMNVSAEPSLIKIGSFYNGSKIHVTGEIPSGTEVAVRVKGALGDVHLKKKGKVGGILWMNTGDVHLKNVPDVFMVYTTPVLAPSLNDPTVNIGYWSIRDEIEVEPANEDKKFLFGEFVKLKESNEVYMIDQDSVQYEDSGPVRKFSVDVIIPPKMKVGKYQVEAFAVKDNHVIASSTAPFSLEEVGFPLFISDLAYNHSLLFGIMAVFVALVAGLAIGMIFRGGGGAH